MTYFEGEVEPPRVTLSDLFDLDPPPTPPYREYVNVRCRTCGRTVHRTSVGTFPWHVVDPTQWRGTWCAGSGKKAK